MSDHQSWQDTPDDDLAAMLAERTHGALTIQQDMNDPDVRRRRGNEWHIRATKALNLLQLHVRQIQAVQATRARIRAERDRVEALERCEHVRNTRIRKQEARQPARDVLFIRAATQMLGKEKTRLIWEEARKRFPTEACWENVT